MEILALDIGTVNVGLARGSTAARIAQPLKTLKTKNIEELKKEIELNGAEAIVVGLPRNLSGEDTDQTRWVRAWVKDAKSSVGLPFYWQDEALTSHLAQGRKAKNQVDEHAEAAAIILQDFLDTPEQERVGC